MKLKTIFHDLQRTDWRDIKDKATSTARGYDVLDHFGEDTDIRSLTYNDIVGFTEAQRQRGVTGSTINRKLAVLSKLYTVAQRHDPKIRRPEIPRQREGKPRQRVLTDQECSALLAWPRWTPVQQAFLTILMDTGCRPSELLDNSEWSVSGDELTLMDTKNGDDRTIILTPDARRCAEYLRQHPVGSYHIFRHQFTKACAELGIAGVCPYTLRHTALTRLAERIDNPLLIQKWAGHRTLATTQRYVKATRTGMEKLAAALRRSA